MTRTTILGIVLGSVMVVAFWGSGHAGSPAQSEPVKPTKSVPAAHLKSTKPSSVSSQPQHTASGQSKRARQTEPRRIWLRTKQIIIVIVLDDDEESSPI